MALIEKLNFTTDERKTILCKNGRDGDNQRYTVIVSGTFGGGTIAVQLSDDGSTWVDNINNGSTLTFAAGGADNVEVSSDELNPVRLGFNLTGSTSANLNISIYDNK